MELQNTIVQQNDKLELNRKVLDKYHTMLNNPILDEFITGFKVEQAHQLERWGQSEEEQKPPHHYILVFTKLLGKLAVAVFDRDTNKFKHHLITLAASGFNCHRQIDKEGTFINNWFYKGDLARFVMKEYAPIFTFPGSAKSYRLNENSDFKSCANCTTPQHCDNLKSCHNI